MDVKRTSVIDTCCKFKPVINPLEIKIDEHAAHMLVLYRNSRLAAQMANPKISVTLFTRLMSGKPPHMNKKRSEKFKGRVHQLTLDQEYKLENIKTSLMMKSLNVFDSALEPKFMKLYPKHSIQVATKILEDTHFLETKEEQVNPVKLLNSFTDNQVQAMIDKPKEIVIKPEAKKKN